MLAQLASTEDRGKVRRYNVILSFHQANLISHREWKFTIMIMNMHFFPYSLFLLHVTLSASFASGGHVYVANILPVDGSNSTTEGTAVVFVGSTSGVIGYAGFASYLESDLVASECTAVNGCGAHIHNGTSCDDSTTQGGHYFVSPAVTEDPWVNERYSSDETGSTNFSGVVNIGTDMIEGKPFLSKFEK